MEYKVQITITGQTGAGTDYQVPVLVGESSGSSGADFDLDALSTDFPAAKNDGGDFRFYAADEVTALPFWVEEVTGSGPDRTAKIWVKVSADLGSNQSIYLYFNGGGANESDGDATFEFFDDFDSGTLDTGKWTAPAIYSISSSVIRIGSTGSGNAGSSLNSASTSIVNNNRQVYRKASMPDTSASYVGGLGFGNVGFINNNWENSSNTCIDRGGGSPRFYQFSSPQYVTTSLEIQTLARVGSTIYGAIPGKSPITAPLVGSGANSIVAAGSRYDSGSYQDVDFIFVKKFQVTEPAFGSATGPTPLSTFAPSPMMHMMQMAGGIV